MIEKLLGTIQFEDRVEGTDYIFSIKLGKKYYESRIDLTRFREPLKKILQDDETSRTDG